MPRMTNLAEGPTELDQSWGLRRQFYDVFMADHAASIARVDPVLLELTRLRMAEILCSKFSLGLRYKPALDAGLTEEKIADLSNYADSPLYASTERVCIEFAELFAIQSSAIDDGYVAKLQKVLGVEPMIYFLKALSVMDQLQRSTVAFDLRPPQVAPPTMPGFVPVSVAAT